MTSLDLALEADPDGGFENPADLKSGLSASRKPRATQPDFQFERPDWTLFRSVGTLSQKAGVTRDLLRRLVLKELTDNGLDAVDKIGEGRVQIGYIEDDCYYVQDDGPGIDGTPEDIARLFSITRPLVSSKLLRIPTRGALGNGMRVIMGAVAASDGWLKVWTRNKCLTLKPQDDGTTAVEATEADFAKGTRVEIVFGPGVPEDYNAMHWAQKAIEMASGRTYRGKSSPWWFDGDAFYELLRAAGGRPVRDLVANLDGCSGPKAGQIASAFKNRACNTMTRADAISLLSAARTQVATYEHGKKVEQGRLGCVGSKWLGDGSYAIEGGEFIIGGRVPQATIPYVVEVWARGTPSDAPISKLHVYVNRTPITGDVYVLSRDREKSLETLSVHGCGLRLYIEEIKKGGKYSLWVNIITPHCPVTTDGKEPDLSWFRSRLHTALDTAIKRERRLMRVEKKNKSEPNGPNDPDKPNEDGAEKPKKRSRKAIIIARLPEGIAHASSNGATGFAQRNLFYSMRPYVKEELGVELEYDTFVKIITGWENENGDIPGMYRDPRGSLYHPHTDESIPLGTKAVDKYKRPAWTFNKILYIEKEGLVEVLKGLKWPERYDCALVSSKGFTTRAVRDLLDLLGDDGEPITVFCCHDADAHGTMIYQTLQDETKARPKRRVEVINLGLEPWEGLSMKLPHENVTRKNDDHVPVATYASEYPAPEGAYDAGGYWEKWLQNKRIELDAIMPLDFVEWLNGKMKAHGLTEKVIPPDGIVRSGVQGCVTDLVRSEITTRVLREARIEEQVAAGVAKIEIPSGSHLVREAKDWLERHYQSSWRNFTFDFAHRLTSRSAA